MSQYREWPGEGSGRRMAIIRHGQTAYNQQEIRCGGDIDIDLTPHGEAQMIETGKTLAETLPEIDVIISSPLRRTLQSAAIIQRFLPRPLFERPELVERRLGEWNGLSIKETEPWLRAKQTPPGGESDLDFTARALAFLDWLAPQPYKFPLVVSSKGIARVLCKRLEGLDGMLLGNGEVLTLPLSSFRRDEHRRKQEQERTARDTAASNASPALDSIILRAVQAR